MELVERDYRVLREVGRWRFLLGRHVIAMCGYPSKSTADRRLKLLIESGYLDRKKVLYGYPGLYTLTHKGRILINANKREDKVRLEHIVHSVAVLDTVIYILRKYEITLDDIMTEKEMHSLDGFGSRQHRSDFIFHQDGKSFAVEVELTLKAKDRLQKNIKANFLEYDSQIWVLEKGNTKIERIIVEETKHYSNISILYLSDILS